ncbi:MAG: SGNH/GDSL hydrolase family protein [Verrucomicrobiota bacterium]
MTCYGPLTLLAAVGATLLAGCATEPKPRLQTQIGESLVFVGLEPAFLARFPDRRCPIHVRSTYQPGSNTVDYVAGRDFSVDYTQGTLSRTVNSALPDFRTNTLYGQLDFDHTRFAGFGNRGFFAYVDYAYPASPGPLNSSGEAALLPQTRARLLLGHRLKIVAFGDSITAGMDVAPPFVFWHRWAAELGEKYPQAEITTLNSATSGDSTAQGLARLDDKVIATQPDLVLIGFGMNDHNRQGVEPALFEANLQNMVLRIRQKTAAEIILYSAFPPNPAWRFGSHRMSDYAAATKRAAQATGCAYADVFDLWQDAAARKKPEDLLANDINHPNEFGHSVYLQAFRNLGL